MVNDSDRPVTNISVWDTLPGELTFISNDFSIPPYFDPDTNYLRWDLGDYELEPGQEAIIRFTVMINDVDLDKLPVTNTAMVDYNDAYYNDAAGTGKHPPVVSEMSFYPTGRPVVFPNPYNPQVDGVVKFDNIVPNSQIGVYTISGENVVTLHSPLHRTTWDGKNRYGMEVSSGIYFFVIKNLSTGQVLKGKLFVVKE